MLILPSKLAYMYIFAEMAVNLAYFKDVIFALVTLFEFSGMAYNTNSLVRANSNTLSWLEISSIDKWLRRLIILNVLFIGLTMVRYCKAAFYRKAEEY